MTQAELAEQVHEKVGFTRQPSLEIVETVLEIIKENLDQGKKVKISGFGNFMVRSKHERRGRNPHTGDPLSISARKVVTFKPSQILKAALNTTQAKEKPDKVMKSKPMPAKAAGRQSGVVLRRPSSTE